MNPVPFILCPNFELVHIEQKQRLLLTFDLNDLPLDLPRASAQLRVSKMGIEAELSDEHQRFCLVFPNATAEDLERVRSMGRIQLCGLNAEGVQFALQAALIQDATAKPGGHR